MKYARITMSSLALSFAGLAVACATEAKENSAPVVDPGAPTETQESDAGTGKGLGAETETTGETEKSPSTGAKTETASCEIPPGSYTVKYTKGAGSLPACGAVPDQTIEIKQTDGGTAKPADGCTTNEDKATCTFTTVCTVKTAGYTTVSNSTVKTKGTIAGSSTSKTTKDSDGSVLSNCSYDFSYNKK